MGILRVLEFPFNDSLTSARQSVQTVLKPRFIVHGNRMHILPHLPNGIFKLTRVPEPASLVCAAHA
jgi:hypothetical protein